MQNSLKNIPKKLIETNTSMIFDTSTAYFGELMLVTNFIEVKGLSTCGVCMGKLGPKFFWDADFLEEKIDTKEKTKMLIIHEMSHILFNHGERTSSYNKAKANIVTDMIINSLIKRDFQECEFIDGMVFVPEEYKEENLPWVFEKLYEWCVNKANEIKNNSNNSKDSDSEKDKTFAKDLPKLFEHTSGETFDKHLLDEVSEEYKKEMIKEIKEKLRNRGLASKDMERFIEALHKPKKDYLKEIKSGLTSIFGTNKKKTYSRLNRHGFLNLKGFKKTGAEITAIIDVSGSMYGNFEKVLNNLFQDNLTINLIQADVKVTQVEKITSKSQLQKIKIKGLGGTVLQPAVDYAKSNFKNTNLVILTDGICDSLNFENIKGKILVLTTDDKIKVIGNKIPKQIVIKDN